MNTPETLMYELSADFARSCDEQDPLASFREEFLFPEHQGEKVVYMTGNSLGLQPKRAKDYIQQELDDWEKHGVEGHFRAKHPWYSYHEILTPKIGKIVGGLDHEVVVTHSLTTNLHLLMISFYRPTKDRYKIICEHKAFPSDQYALESQAQLHGLDPKEAIIEVAPRDGEHHIRHEDIVQTIREHGETVALVMFGGVNYYIGQRFDMADITKEAHAVGAICGFDLAHAAGNVELKLHDWGVDFAAWCSYKYLNSSPGGVSGMFIHERHGNNPDTFRLAGWWGHDKDERFKMEPGFKPIPGAEGWQLSNAPVLSMAAHNAALDIFMEAGFDRLLEKSRKLTGYLEFCIEALTKESEGLPIEIITPKDPSMRGCQLSMLITQKGRAVFEHLEKNGVIADWREPDVIRLAPVPLYNSFNDMHRFTEILREAMKENGLWNG